LVRHIAGWGTQEIHTEFLIENPPWKMATRKRKCRRSKVTLRYISEIQAVYDCVPKSFRTGRLKRELQMVQLSATRCSCTAIW
jgi:hypothetical protein